MRLIYVGECTNVLRKIQRTILHFCSEKYRKLFYIFVISQFIVVFFFSLPILPTDVYRCFLNIRCADTFHVHPIHDLLLILDNNCFSQFPSEAPRLCLERLNTRERPAMDWRTSLRTGIRDYKNPS